MKKSTPRRSAVSALLPALAAAVLAQQEPTQVRPPAETMRPEITGARGIVAGGRNYSVAAGIRMLEKGGNAVDAGVAAVFAASVVEISHFGFGGECPLMIYDAKTKKVVVVNGQGPAPKAATPELFRAKGKVDANGPLAATVPAVLDALAIALAEHGTMRLEEVMAPAIEYADGFPMYAFLRDYLVRERKATERWEWSKKTYYAGGRVPDVGEVFRQPNLARTLREIVAAEKAEFGKTRDRKAAIRAGRDAFYRGPLARRIAEADRGAGGVLDYQDLAGFHGRSRFGPSSTATRSSRRVPGTRGRCFSRRSTFSRASISPGWAATRPTTSTRCTRRSSFPTTTATRSTATPTS